MLESKAKEELLSPSNSDTKKEDYGKDAKGNRPLLVP